MRPVGLATKIFLDSGDPAETRQILQLLGFLDGQTTNPTLVSRHPQVSARLKSGRIYQEKEIYKFYQEVVEEISSLIPQGSVSLEVNVDHSSTAENIIRQAREMFAWIPNAHIKFPIISAGLQAAAAFVKEGKRVNLTLVFSQAQAAAVYAATRGAAVGQVYISPFVGRLDEQGENGMDLVKNIRQMYLTGDGHVQILTASVRSLEHFRAALALGSDIVTAPFRVLREWAEQGFSLPATDYHYQQFKLRPITYEKISLEKNWPDYHIQHALTDQGIEQFSQDWNNLVKRQ